MKSSFIIILLTTILNIVNSQTTPYFIEDSTGNRYVVLSESQARTLDNLSDYSPILWKDNSCKEVVDSVRNKVESECKIEIQSRDFKISQSDKEKEIMRFKIDNLESTVKGLQELNEIHKESYKMYVRESEYKLKRERITTRIVAGMGLMGFTGLLLFLL